LAASGHRHARRLLLRWLDSIQPRCCCRPSMCTERR
jgi:hypothetical protein